MLEVTDAIKQRRSIRKYLPQQVPRTLVEEVLVAAGWAPSAHNSQPWRFIILEDALVKQALADAMADAWTTDLVKDGAKIDAKIREGRVERFENAPVLILACSTMEGLRKFPDEKRQICEHDLAMQSLGAAMQNLLLMAHVVGLGACWFCAPCFCKETVRKMLKIPDAVEPEAFVIMGYSAEIPLVPTKKSLGEYCFMDMWDKKI